MKTNLDKVFKNDSKSENDGIWFNVNEQTGFLVRRFGGFNSPKIKPALAKYYKPYARQVEAGTLSAEKENEIITRVFVEACLIDWRGVEIDGKETPFEKELAVKFFCSLPELAETIIGYSQDSKNYREDLGNS